MGVLTLYAIIIHASAALKLRAEPQDAPVLSVRLQAVAGVAKMDVLEARASAV